MSKSMANTTTTHRTILFILRFRFAADLCAGSSDGAAEGAGSSGFPEFAGLVRRFQSVLSVNRQAPHM